MSNWYGTSGWALCSLLGIIWWNHWKCQLPCMFPVPVSCPINTLVVFKRNFLLWLWKIEADAWFTYFYQVLESCWMCLCWDWGHPRFQVALPDSALRTPASFLWSPGCLRLQAGGIVVVLAGGVVAAGLQVVLPAVGPLSPMMTRALPLTRRTLQQSWGTWPAWWGVNKHALLSICCKSERKRICGGGGKGTRFESYITCYVAHSNHYVMYYFQTAI